MKKFLRKYWDEGVVYLLAFSGALVSANLEQFKNAGAVHVDLSYGRLIVTAVLALAASFASEAIPWTLKGEQLEKARAGKRSKGNITLRFFRAILFGVAATKLVDIGTMLPGFGG